MLAKLDLLSIAAEKYPRMSQISKRLRLITVHPDFSKFGRDIGPCILLTNIIFPYSKEALSAGEQVFVLRMSCF